MLFKDIFVPLTICIDQTRRALVIVLPCYGALEIVGVIIIIIINRLQRRCVTSDLNWQVTGQSFTAMVWRTPQCFCNRSHARRANSGNIMIS